MVAAACLMDGDNSVHTSPRTEGCSYSYINRSKILTHG